MQKTYCKITISGIVDNDPALDHEVKGKKFYLFKLVSKRTSSNSDILNVIAEESLVKDIKKGDFVKIEGSIRSKNIITLEKRRLFVYVFAKSLTKVENSDQPHENFVEIVAHICKIPVLRTTPLGKQITDAMLVVNRSYNKQDYIPVISWNKTAKNFAKYAVGDVVKITGRFQSRDYVKVVNDIEETRTAYEVSIFSATNLSTYRTKEVEVTKAVG